MVESPRRLSSRLRVERLALSLGLIVVGTLHSGAAFQQAPVPRKLGTVEVLSGPAGCSGAECYEIRVTCSEVAAPARARLKVAAAGKSPRGTILFASGGLGTASYDSTPEPARILSDLSTAGFRTVQLQWIDSWALGSAGKEEGHVRLGCRPATVARWVHDHLHQPGPTCRVLRDGPFRRRGTSCLHAESPWSRRDSRSRRPHRWAAHGEDRSKLRPRRREGCEPDVSRLGDASHRCRVRLFAAGRCAEFRSERGAAGSRAVRSR